MYIPGQGNIFGGVKKKSPSINHSKYAGNTFAKAAGAKPAGSYSPSGGTAYPGQKAPFHVENPSHFANYVMSGGGGSPGPGPGSSGGGSSYGRRYGGGGGGGGGPAPAGIDQATYDALMARIRAAKPAKYKYQPLDLPEYNAPEFYAFDRSPYEQALEGIAEGVANAREIGDTAFDRIAAEYDAYQNPYTDRAFTQSPGIDPALERSMAAFSGAGQEAVNAQLGEGLESDAAFGNLLDILSGAEDSYIQGLQRAVEGDRLQNSLALQAQETGLRTGVNMALAQAKSAYDKEKWAYGVDEAQRRYDARVQEAMANYQGRNAAHQYNVGQLNNYRMEALEPFIELAMAGINGAGKQTLKL